MKIDDLTLFIKVVEPSSFTAAANALDLLRANVSRRIGELEQSLGGDWTLPQSSLRECQ